MRLQSINLAAILASIRPDEDPIIVAGCDPCQLPFGGRLDDGGEPRYGEATVGDRSAATMPNGNPVYSLLAQLGAQPCRLWGADAPNQCVDANGCFVGGKKVCGAIMPYRATVGATDTPYTLRAKKWFWPLMWVDASNTDIVINTLEFQGDSVFENGVGAGPLRPSAMFPSDGTNFVPGLPAIDNTSGLDFVLADVLGAGSKLFEGMFVGISIRN